MTPSLYPSFEIILNRNADFLSSNLQREKEEGVFRTIAYICATDSSSLY